MKIELYREQRMLALATRDKLEQLCNYAKKNPGLTNTYINEGISSIQILKHSIISLEESYPDIISKYNICI